MNLTVRPIMTRSRCRQHIASWSAGIVSARDLRSSIVENEQVIGVFTKADAQRVRFGLVEVDGQDPRLSRAAARPATHGASGSQEASGRNCSRLAPELIGTGDAGTPSGQTCAKLMRRE